MTCVRELAKGLEKSSRHRGVTHVSYVHREGRIDALAKRNSSSGDPEVRTVVVPVSAPACSQQEKLYIRNELERDRSLHNFLYFHAI